jgi:hypothetical protein
MTDEWIPYVPTEKAQLLSLRMRVEYLETLLREMNGLAMDLHLYVRAVEGMPTAVQWEMVRVQARELVRVNERRDAD